MHADDFLRTEPDDAMSRTERRPGHWMCQLWELDLELMELLRFGPLPAEPDLEVAVALPRLLHEDFVAMGTSHDEGMNDEEVVLAVKAHRAVLSRLGLKPPQLPFRHTAGSTTPGARTTCPAETAGRLAASASKSFLAPTREAPEELQEIEYEQRFKNGPR
ncbi:hypothetical protein OG226_00785 [Streptomyces sp. NBC_01261]|uniref:hypothetical protein n=1 Tax=Streptomyces sp. NBC_01261 TaxID=2903802 RepID=UPI002E37D332|nr:hypothetical protein [Streptomyces sp. NBC_01261]